MLLRSGHSVSFIESCRRRGGSSCASTGRRRLSKNKSSGEASTCASGDVAGHLLKRKSFGEEEAAPACQVKRKSPPASSSKQLPDGFSEHDPGAWVQLAPPEPGAFPPDDSSGVDDSFNETSILELGAKVFPSLPPDLADTAWRRFLKNANICIKHYNTKYHADFVYKHVVESGLFLLGEQDSKMYFHINFYAHDSKGHSHLFFGEIRVRVAPKEEDVSCCQPVSNSDAGGKSLRTIEDMRKATFPIWGTAGVDREHCYGCPSEMRHPAGTCYVAGHVADSRHYFVP
ncbi:hypothetical protein U9M48_025649 [Paspalum notatum var. saurae]|uniref:DUF3615 domain-containing protein n=1 Tax=Paspalum notatum var. saurae TaxID=547442 RepID=A0AAQ3TSZ9_PASNO